MYKITTMNATWDFFLNKALKKAESKVSTIVPTVPIFISCDVEIFFIIT